MGIVSSGTGHPFATIKVIVSVQTRAVYRICVGEGEGISLTTLLFGFLSTSCAYIVLSFTRNKKISSLNDSLL